MTEQPTKNSATQPADQSAPATLIPITITDAPSNDEQALAKTDMPSYSTGEYDLKAVGPIHHKIAFLMAAGNKTNIEISQQVGLSTNYLSVLKRSPLFQDLLSKYIAKEEELRDFLRERIAALGSEALSILHQRLLDKPETFDNDQLRALMGDMFNRSGHGAKEIKSFEGNLNVPPELLEAMRHITRERDAKIIDVTPIEEEDESSESNGGADTAPTRPELLQAAAISEEENRETEVGGAGTEDANTELQQEPKSDREARTEIRAQDSAPSDTELPELSVELGAFSESGDSFYGQERLWLGGNRPSAGFPNSYNSNGVQTVLVGEGVSAVGQVVYPPAEIHISQQNNMQASNMQISATGSEGQLNDSIRSDQEPPATD